MAMPPRANLLLDDEYCDFIFATPRGEYQGGPGLSLNDYWVSGVDDPQFKPYFSKSHVVNTYMVSPTELLYTIPYNKQSLAKVRDFALAHISSWLDLLDNKHDATGVLFKDIGTFPTQAELLRLDVRMRQFVGRDPDTRNVVKILGQDTVNKLVRTMYGDPDDVFWKTR
eukprot:scaffold1456_cov118-Isochrysis_galbana.AAC.2